MHSCLAHLKGITQASVTHVVNFGAPDIDDNGPRKDFMTNPNGRMLARIGYFHSISKASEKKYATPMMEFYSNFK